MRRWWVCALIFLGACSTHPVVDTLDCLFPGELGPQKVDPYGGVCRPQGPLTLPSAVVPTATILPPTPMFPAGAGVVPPPAPLPPASFPPPPPGFPTK